MSAIYDTPPKEAVDMLAAVMQEFKEFEPLVAAGVTCELSFAFGREKKDGTLSPALKHGGHTVNGIAKKIGPEDRAHGRPDCRITVNGDFWKTAKDEEKRALLHHELYHFDLVTDDAGDVKRDDNDRPEIKYRHHDYEVGFFALSAERFGRASQECIYFRAMVERDGQLLLPAVFGNEIAHNGDTLTLTRPDGTEATIPAEDLARVHAATERQLAAAAPAE